MLHDQISEVEVDVDTDTDQRPGLVGDPVDEEEIDKAPGVEVCIDEVEFEPMTWDQMCDPMSPVQMALIHQMEHVGGCTGTEQTLTEAVQTDAQWQKQFQSSNRNASETESDPDMIDLDELVGLCGLGYTAWSPVWSQQRNTFCGHTHAPMFSAR